MAIINTYPTATPKGADLLIGTQVKDDTVLENSTKSFAISAIGSFLITSNDIVTGSGTTNTIPIWTDGPNGVLGDSIITYDDTSTPIITIGPSPSRLVIDGDLAVNNRATFSGPYARFDCPMEVNQTYYDAAGDEGTDGDVLLAKGTPGNMSTRWTSLDNAGITSQIKSEKIIVSTAELRNLHTTPKILVDVTAGNPKEICQVYSVVFGVGTQTLVNNLTFPNDLKIQSDNAGAWEYTIPQATVNSQSVPFYVPSLTAGNSGLDSDVVLTSAGAAVETGTATTTMTVWITYRIFEINE